MDRLCRSKGGGEAPCRSTSPRCRCASGTDRAARRLRCDSETVSADDREPRPDPTASRIEVAPRTILLLLVVIAGIWLAFQLETVLIVVTIALVMVGTLDPMVAWFERRGIRRGRALVLIFAALALVAAGVLLLTVPPLITQLLHL